jgi:hypothetical protein
MKQIIPFVADLTTLSVSGLVPERDFFKTEIQIPG